MVTHLGCDREGLKNQEIGQSAAKPVREGSTTRSLFDPRVHRRGVYSANLKDFVLVYSRMEVESQFKTIVSIREKHTNKNIELSSCSIQLLAAKYSNTKVPIAKLVIDSKSISRNNTILVSYTCPTCEIKHEITLNLFMRRIAKNTIHCLCCVNKEKEKCETQSKYMKINMTHIISGDYVKLHEKVSEKSLDDFLEFSRKAWDEEDAEFINHYNLTHLLEDEYTHILPKIKSVGNGKIVDLNGWSYFPHYRVFNQTRYTPMLIHSIDMKVEKPQYITFGCENCGKDYTHRDLEVVKNKLKLFCQECTLTNRTFRLRSCVTKDGTKLLWQSTPEKRFIEWCDEHSIPIKNGPTIQYKFQDKLHNYRVDFELPSFKRLIEIKDNHCWHQQQLASGKFGAKETAAIEWCNKNGYTFSVIFPKTLQELKGSLLKPRKI